MAEPSDPEVLAKYVFEWLRVRNGGELREAIESMTVGSHDLAHRELAMILEHGGKPPNWER